MCKRSSRVSFILVSLVCKRLHSRGALVVLDAQVDGSCAEWSRQLQCMFLLVSDRLGVAARSHSQQAIVFRAHPCHAALPALGVAIFRTRRGRRMLAPSLVVPKRRLQSHLRSARSHGCCHEPYAPATGSLLTFRCMLFGERLRTAKGIGTCAHAMSQLVSPRPSSRRHRQNPPAR